jgi:hypothetical protein
MEGFLVEVKILVGINVDVLSAESKAQRLVILRRPGKNKR